MMIVVQPAMLLDAVQRGKRAITADTAALEVGQGCCGELFLGLK